MPRSRRRTRSRSHDCAGILGSEVGRGEYRRPPILERKVQRKPDTDSKRLPPFALRRLSRAGGFIRLLLKLRCCLWVTASSVRQSHRPERRIPVLACLLIIIAVGLSEHSAYDCRPGSPKSVQHCFGLQAVFRLAAIGSHRTCKPAAIMPRTRSAMKRCSTARVLPNSCASSATYSLIQARAAAETGRTERSLPGSRCKRQVPGVAGGPQDRGECQISL